MAGNIRGKLKHLSKESHTDSGKKGMQGLGFAKSEISPPFRSAWNHRYTWGSWNRVLML